MNPLIYWARSRLHRRIFVWFGLTILLTGMIVGGVSSITGAPSWKREVDGARRFVMHELSRNWDDPVKRDAFARNISEDMHVSVMLTDASERPLTSFGSCDHPYLSSSVVRDGSVVGHFTVCPGVERRKAPVRGALMMVLAVMVVWAASGRIARRITRPLAELASIAEDIGRGRFSRRSTLSEPCRDRRPHDEVDVVARVLDDMAARVEKQIRDQRELLAAVSHEIRTPLARIRLLVEMARDAGATAKTLDGIDTEVVEIDALVSQLLASARLEFQALTLHAIDPKEAAIRALERASVAVDKLAAGAGLPTVEADATLLARALANVIENAKHHAGGVDCLRVERGNGVVRFLVDDRGPGLPDGDSASLFLPFVQSAGDAVKQHGSIGLGLALVARIVEAHGGKTIAQAREGGGATIGFELPIDGPSATPRGLS